ncbi:MAG: OmpA family protein [Cyclobacteriaceae bacterium]|nr:OmpA family protein [Cyclobacteriaceae bacterium]
MKLKLLVYSILLVILCLFYLPVSAQKFSNKPISPSKMCHYIHKQRTKKIKKKFSLSKPVNDMSRISYSPDNIHYQRPSFKAPPVKKEDILSVPELVASNKKFNPPSGPLPEPVNQRQAEIREIVKEKISSGEANEPILESLFFITDEAEFAYVDFDPFLLAVEFALQGKMVLVEGHTDDRGSDEHNLQLSMERVRQIETLMRDIGVPEERVSVIGYGESMPKYDNSTEEGQQKNRRVDFKIF